MGGNSPTQNNVTPAPTGFQGQPYSATFPAGQPGQLEALAAQLQRGGYGAGGLDFLQKLFSPTETRTYQPIPGMSTTAQTQVAPSTPAVTPTTTPGGFTDDQMFDSLSWMPNRNRR